MKRSWGWGVMISGLFAVLVGLLASSSEGLVYGSDITGKQQLVKVLQLTDLSLCSEARYTRHPTQADLFSAFQDYPAAFEHFPTGSLFPLQPVGMSQRVEILLIGAKKE